MLCSCGDLFGGDLYEEEQAGELAKFVEKLEGSEADGEALSPYVQKITNLVSPEPSTLHFGTPCPCDAVALNILLSQNENGSYAALIDEFLPKLATIYSKGSEDGAANPQPDPLAAARLTRLCGRCGRCVQHSVQPLPQDVREGPGRVHHQAHRERHLLPGTPSSLTRISPPHAATVPAGPRPTLAPSRPRDAANPEPALLPG